MSVYRRAWAGPCAAIAFAAVLLSAPAAVAQDAPADSVTVADGTAGPFSPRRPSPAGAFARSLVVPGWGQAANGSYLRGGVYFAAQTGSWFMLVKTMGKLAEARDIAGRRAVFARDSLLARAAHDPALEELLDDPAALADAVDADPRVAAGRDLVSARKQQREDWIAWSLFWMLASGVDAFVTAHLSDFPDWFAAEPAPRGGVQLRLSVPVGSRP